MPTSERGEGQRSYQDMTLLLLLALTAGLAGRVRSEDYYTTGAETGAVGDTALNVGGDDVRLIPTDFTTLHSPGDEGSITDETGLSGGGELDSPVIHVRRNPTLFNQGPTEAPLDDGLGLHRSSLNPLVVIIPLVLLILLLAAVAVAVCLIGRRRAKQHGGTGDMRDDEILHGCETEKVPMPMFEDDVPSVLELEMEDLEKWMIKDPGGICVDSAGGEG
ncbi:hypothetical protein SKAU_G00390210 [Synaphobranchus kaupii]|uniref:Transmembrane protein 154 n=1 Tax=Synaphobranchus kaupii TaxID=118154 RepID=A0A9Q1EBE7_SYNKA|nr:hypothetical protein SKAU_G00390210 [Synaphobranchus kaupii]